MGMTVVWKPTLIVCGLLSAGKKRGFNMDVTVVWKPTQKSVWFQRGQKKRVKGGCDGVRSPRRKVCGSAWATSMVGYDGGIEMMPTLWYEGINLLIIKGEVG